MKTIRIFLITFITILLISTGSKSESNLQEISVGLATMRQEIENRASPAAGDHVKRGAELSISDFQKVLIEKKLKVTLKEFYYQNSDLSALSTSQQACESNVLALHGYDYSSHSLIAADNHINCKLPMVTPSSTANRLSEYPGYIHQVSYTNEYQSVFLAKVAVNYLKAKHAVILVPKDCAYCTDLAQSFGNNIRNYPGIAVKTISILSDEKSFAELEHLFSNSVKKPDLLFLPMYEVLAAKVIRFLKGKKIKIKVLGADGWTSLGALVVGKELSGSEISAYSVAHWNIDIKSKKSVNFIKLYREKYKADPSDIAALSYDSMSVILEAILKSNNPSRVEIESNLKKLSHYPGVTGVLNLSPNSKQHKPIYLMKLNENGFSLVSEFK